MTESNKIDAVLLDDDFLVHMTWKMVAKRLGKNLTVFESVEKLRENLAHIPKSTPVYIDSGLGNGVRGEDIAQQLFKDGYQNLYLATGRSLEELPELPWIKKVVGKEPPWEG
ncbi:MAG: hypothetical protein AB1540_12820 [Bdellovibrionota bacterium]